MSNEKNMGQRAWSRGEKSEDGGQNGEFKCEFFKTKTKGTIKTPLLFSRDRNDFKRAK
jgi:hypothetical protein